MNLDQIRDELGAFFRTNNKMVASWVYDQESQLSKFAKVITKVKGKYPSIHAVMGHVVQQFTTTWNEIGEAKIRVNELESYHQKVNFPLIPDEIEGSWLAELNNRNQDLQARSISRFIAEEVLAPRVREDLAILEIVGEYDAAQPETFGYSEDGIEHILDDALANAENSAYPIPLDALTDSNMVDMVTLFEQRLPTKAKRLVKQIFMSRTNYERYILDYENSLGSLNNFTDQKKLRTRLGGREIVPVDYMESDKIFTFIPGNLVKLVDFDDAPKVTDVQKVDYKLKIFMEWWRGWMFMTNQGVFCSVTNGSGSGLTTDNDQYYSEGK